MTTAEKLTSLKAFLDITDTTQDTKLTAYLSFAKNEIIAWRYGGGTSQEIAKSVDSLENRVTVDAVTFIGAISPTSGTSYAFTYVEDNWQYDSANVELSDYGISSPDEPEEGETITVRYSEAALVKFDNVQIMACVAGYGISGAENQTSHSENGINRNFKYSDMVDYLHAHIPAHCGVI